MCNAPYAFSLLFFSFLLSFVFLFFFCCSFAGCKVNILKHFAYAFPLIVKKKRNSFYLLFFQFYSNGHNLLEIFYGTLLKQHLVFMKVASIQHRLCSKKSHRNFVCIFKLVCIYNVPLVCVIFYCFFPLYVNYGHFRYIAQGMQT